MANLDGYNPADFGADRIVSHPNRYGGQHYTAFSNSGGQISWNTDGRGNYVDGSVHMSDRNIAPQAPFNVWDAFGNHHVVGK